MTVHGKGTYVAATDKQLAIEARRKAVEDEFSVAVSRAKGVGMSNQEIAERTHMSTNLVAVRINRAKKMLRSRIDRANFYMG